MNPQIKQFIDKLIVKGLRDGDSPSELSMKINLLYTNDYLSNN